MKPKILQEIDDLWSQQAAKASQVALDTANTNIALKAEKTYVDTLAQSLASGSPKGTYATLVALQTAYPTGNTNIYVVTADGKWYYWNGTAWTAGGTYQSTGIADKAVVPRNTSFTNERNIFNVNSYNLINCNILSNGTALNPSASNSSIYVPIIGGETYVVSKILSSYFALATTSVIPASGVACIDYISSNATKTERTIQASATANYLVVWLYNTGDSKTLTEILASLSILNKKDAKHGKSAINFPNISFDDGQIPLSAIKYDSGSVCSKKYYATIKNPIDMAYTNAPIQIKVNFEKGECLSQKCIRVTDTNGNIIPFQFDDDYEENFINEKNTSYYGDSSIRCGTIWIVGTLDIGESKNYIIWVYDTPLTDVYTSVITSNESFDGLYLSHGTAYIEYKVSNNYNVNSYNFSGTVKQFYGDSRFVYNGSTVRFKDCSLVSIKIKGNGVVFKEVEKIFNYNNYIEITERTRLYSNNKFECRTWFKLLTDTTTLGLQMAALQPYKTSSGVLYTTSGGSNFTNGATWNDGDTNLSLFVDYCNGLRNRDDNSVQYRSEINYSEKTSTVIEISAGCFQNITNYQLYAGRVFTSGYSVVYGAITNEYLRQFNALVTFATKDVSALIKSRILDKIIPHLKHISSYCEAEIINQSFDYYHMIIWARYAQYKYSNKYTLSNLGTEFINYLTSYYGGNTAAGMMTSFQNGMGLQYSARYVPIAYLIYKEFIKLGDNTNANIYSNVLVEYAKFIGNLYTQYNDVPITNTAGVGNGNSRCSALHCLALGKLFSSDTSISTAYNGILTLIKDNIVWGKTHFQEGNPSTNRYLHYVAYANYEFMLANDISNITVDGLTSNYIDMFKSVHPSGEIKDLIYCCDDTRRGGSVTYAYVLGVLAKSGNISGLAIAEKIVDHLISLDLPFGGRISDFSTSYIPSFDSGQLFEIQGLLDLIEVNF